MGLKVSGHLPPVQQSLSIIPVSSILRRESFAAIQGHLVRYNLPTSPFLTQGVSWGQVQHFTLWHLLDKDTGHLDEVLTVACEHCGACLRALQSLPTSLAYWLRVRLDNARARALYHAVGFRDLPHGPQRIKPPPGSIYMYAERLVFSSISKDKLDAPFICHVVCATELSVSFRNLMVQALQHAFPYYASAPAEAHAAVYADDDQEVAASLRACLVVHISLPT